VGTSQSDLLNTGAQAMTVADLVALLSEFPPELPVFFCPDEVGRAAVIPRDAVMDLVHPTRGEVLADGTPSIPDGFIDALVIHPCVVRDDG
jgi:hypothetical protein